MIDSIELPPSASAKRCAFSNAQTTGQWQQTLQNYVTSLKERYRRPKLCPAPCLHIVDSISNETIPPRNDPDPLALKIGFNLMHSDGRWPITFHFINHNCDTSNHAQDINSSLDLLFKLGGTSSYSAAKAKIPGCGREGAIINIQVKSSSMGSAGTDQAISVPVLIKHSKNEETGKNRRVIMFDWGAADAHFLSMKYELISNIFPLESKCVSGSGAWMKSEALGVNDFIPASIFGLILQSNQEVMQGLRNELGIETRPPFAEEVDPVF